MTLRLAAGLWLGLMTCMTGACVTGGAAGEAAGTAPAGAAHDFEVRDLGGQTVRLSDLRGKLVVLDFWASWCEPCLQELPELDRLQKDLADRGVVVLAINIDKQRENAAAMVERLKLSLRVGLDPDGQVVGRYGPEKMPTLYVVDREGVVRHVQQGFDGARDTARLRAVLTRLAGPTGPTSPGQTSPTS